MHGFIHAHDGSFGIAYCFLGLLRVRFERHEMQREQFEKIIRGMILKREAKERPERETIYAAARASLQRKSDVSAGEIAELDAAIHAIEATFAQVTPYDGADGLKEIKINAIALLLGIVVGAAGMAFISAPTETADAAAFEELKQIYSEQAALMPDAIRFIQDVRDVIEERQTSDEASLVKISNKLTQLSQFDPDLAKQMPQTLPRGTSVLVRADAYDMKVLMNWTLCGVASVANPEMVDRRRARISAIGCPYFGLWTEGAADW